MRKEYDIKNLNPRKNPYTKKKEKHIKSHKKNELKMVQEGIPQREAYEPATSIYDCAKNNQDETGR